MALTPMEIHNKDFRRKFRGYDPDEVDQFLDNVVEDYESLYKENMDLKERLRVSKECIESYKTIEDTLKETLITAQKAADELVASSQKRAEVIVSSAESESAKILSHGKDSLLEIVKEQEEYKKRLDIFKIKFRKLLEAEMELIADKEFSE